MVPLVWCDDWEHHQRHGECALCESRLLADGAGAMAVSDDEPLSEPKFPLDCCLCGELLSVNAKFTQWSYGNNPEPLMSWPNRCCDVCNDTKVIPARLAAFTNRRVGDD